MANYANVTGEKFGLLTAIKIVGKNKQGRYMWECLCDCGNKTIVSVSSLKNGMTKSCGCMVKNNHFKKDKSNYRKESIEAPHGVSLTPLYKVWQTMKTRCYNKKVHSYKLYGGRGIGVCDEWKDNYRSFQKWALDSGYDGTLTLDRIDTNKDYSPDNCRWADMKEQSNNTRRNKWITYKGETKTMIQWSECLNIPYATLRGRIYNGWEVDRAFNQPWQ